MRVQSNCQFKSLCSHRYSALNTVPKKPAVLSMSTVNRLMFAMVLKSQKSDIVNSHFQEWPCTSTCVCTSGKIRNHKRKMSRNGPSLKNAHI